MLRAITVTASRDVEVVDALPLTLQPGDQVSLSDPDPERPGYRWASDGGLCSGWVPEAVLTIRDRLGIARSEYCSQELAVEAGQVLRLMWRGEGFPASWCESSDGERGWVPDDALAPSADPGVDA
ncbi:hypothetical protein [Pseudomarimonas salicorniae]|uniref:SH3 domain-containing protein n=1 Tax=Pseudomarimonas salicorniae TaxID=2933270 RepID=A0ABT0GCD3_9GAMM|nr:hypothetical protein [Lysobacter sp. CAU 1642]MCK7592203.1 hypothetical protein [Lysobacter sp. CAU 1642]